MELDTYYTLPKPNPIKLVLSIDPGLHNLGLVLLSYNENLQESTVVLAGHYDLGEGKKSPMESISRKLHEVFHIRLYGRMADRGYDFCQVDWVLIENQKVGRPMEQLEGMLYSLTTALCHNASFKSIYPPAVSRWTGQKFLSRSLKKKWTLAKMSEKYQMKMSIDEADAFLNYDYFISGLSKKKK